MTWLSALLPVKDGVAVKVALTRAADSARAAGDARSQGQLQADILVDSVLASAVGRATTDCCAPTRSRRRRAGSGGAVDLGAWA